MIELHPVVSKLMVDNCIKIDEELDEPDDILDSSAEDEKNFWKSKEKELLTSTIEYSLISLADILERGKINLSPQYQRRHRWDIVKKSKLIESFIMHVPVPPIYLNEDKKGKLSVIDGKQRLTAISDFFRKGLKLQGLEVHGDLNELSFSELPQNIQDDLSTVPVLRAIILLRQSGEDLKFEVFKRLNTGGVILNPQEIRNSTYPGPLNDLILELSENAKFHKLLGITDKSKSKIYQEMGDAELVLRYLTFHRDWKKFSGSIRHAMDRFMADNQYISRKEILEMKIDFLRTLGAVEACFGDHAFRRWLPDKGNWKDQVNISLYDAEMFACMGVNAENAKPKRDQIIDAFMQLSHDSDFKKATYSGTNARSSFIHRITKVKDIIEEILSEAQIA